MHYGQLENLNWLWWVAIVLAIAIFATVRHYRASLSFASAELLRRMAPMNWSIRIISLMLSTLALLAIVVGLVDIRWGRVWRDVPQRGIEVMFVLDVSRSMLAEDTSPNRLERSKQYIKDLVEQMAGDRVGLVLFAGDVKRQMPLTNHYGDFVSALDEIGPHNIDRGGSNLGQAIEVAADAFLEKTSEHRAIVLFTDGEYHESEPIEAAKRALLEHGTRIFTIGIGDAGAGAQIPDSSRRGGQFIKHDGRAVVSKLNDSVLEQIALTTDGAYIPAGTKHVDMDAVYHQFIANIEQQDFESARVNSYVPRYQWFLGFALLMLLADILLGAIRKLIKVKDRVSDTENHVAGHSSRIASTAAVIVVFAIVFSADTGLADESAATLVQQGQTALTQGDAATAIERFSSAQSLGFSDPRVNYNMGIAHYNVGDIESARSAFAQAAESTDRTIAGQARYNIGNTYYAEALQRMQADPQAAMSSLATAIDHYRGALTANRKDEDARANIELAHRLKQQLQKQQEQQPQQDQSQENEEQQEGSESESEQKQSEEQNDDAQEEKEDQNNGDQQEQDSEQQENNESQNENGEENQEKSEGQDESKQNESEPQSSDGEQEQQGDQSDSQEGNEKPEDESQGEGSEPPKDGELEAINEQGEAAEPGSEGKEGPPMTMQEARKLLQAVRDRELRNRIEKLRRMRPRRVNVEKDW